MLGNFEEIKKTAQLEWEAFNDFKRPRILIGTATCGRAAGALNVSAAFKKALAVRSIDADIYEVGCFGMCYAEPLVEIGLPDGRRVMYGNVTKKMATRLVKDFIKKGNPRPDLALATVGDNPIEGIPAISDLPMIQEQVRFVLRNAGIIDPTNVYHYIAREGYSGLANALEMAPEAVIDEIKQSGLRGRGGPGFPTGPEWEFARRTQRYIEEVICNADEGDPGAFMSRLILESDPHAVLEGLAITAYAIGAKRAIIYVRGEYALAIERFQNALRQLDELGLIGENILGSDFSLSIKIKERAGIFIRGEETSLNASIEGHWGMPKPKPPFFVNSSLTGKPTVINNVETMANVSGILTKGAECFSQYGTEKSRGTKTFALAGKINHVGLIEVPMGTRLQDIIYKIGGGIPNGKKLKAVQIGGASGGCLPAKRIDLAVDYDELTQAGAMMGSGGLIVLDEDSCMVDIAKYFLEFARSESCEKCTLCNIGSSGSEQLLRLLTEITEGKASSKHLDKLETLSQTIKSHRLCGLGQTLPNPVLSTLRYFRNEFETHIQEKKCDASVCRGLAPLPDQYANILVPLMQRMGRAISAIFPRKSSIKQRIPAQESPAEPAMKEFIASQNLKMADKITNKILVIDDEKIVGESLRRTFQDEDYELDTAYSGLEGLQKARGGNYDLMLVDLKMPDISGLDVIKTIKKEQPDTMMIMITGYSTTESATEALKSGAFDYIPKPFTPEKISSVVERAFVTREQRIAI